MRFRRIVCHLKVKTGPQITRNPVFDLNNANLRDLIAVTNLVILLKLDSNLRFSARVTLKFDRWPRKITRHFFYITSSFVHHLKHLGELKLELLAANTQFGSKSAIFCKANLRDLIAATGLVILLKLDANRRFFSQCDLEIWCMIPKNNRAPPLCYFKFFASFRSHWWIQTGVTVRKRLIWVKIEELL